MLIDYFNEFDYHLLNDNKPSVYFNSLINYELYPTEYPYTMISRLMKIEQNPKYHPEGNVWNHTMQVVDNAAFYSRLSSNKRCFMWTSLLHDIGKGTTTQVRGGKITSYNHDTEGSKLARIFFTTFKENKSFIDDVCKMVRWHMQPLFLSKNLPFAKIKEMLSEVSASELGLFSLCDRLGRGNFSNDEQSEEFDFVIAFLENCYEKTFYSGKKQNIQDMISALSQIKVLY